MKKHLILLAVLLSFSCYSQTYFYEDFNYESFDYLDSLYQNKDKKHIWRTEHAVENIDITEDGVISSEEKFKRTSIVQDPFDKNNKIIRFELNRVSPKFYSKYACDDSEHNNVITDSVLNKRFKSQKKLYCTDCQKDSPLKRNFYEWDVHMKRNEIAISGSKKRKLYKTNRDHWFGFKMLVDPEYEFDTVKNGEIVTQFHVLGKNAKSPPVTIVIANERFQLVIIKNNDGKPKSYDLGPVNKNKWVNWKFHLVLSKRDKKGFVEVWRDGEKLQSISGKNIGENFRMYLKIGVYKYGWWNCDYETSDSSKKIISFDKVWADKKDKFPRSTGL